MTKWVNCFQVWVRQPLDELRLSRLIGGYGVLWCVWYMFILFFGAGWLRETMFLMAGVLALFFLAALRYTFQKRTSLASGLAISRKEKVRYGFLGGSMGMAGVLLLLLLAQLGVLWDQLSHIGPLWENGTYPVDPAFWVAFFAGLVLVYAAWFPVCVLKKRAAAAGWSILAGAVTAAWYAGQGLCIREMSVEEIVRLYEGNRIAQVTVRYFQLPGGWLTAAVLTVLAAAAVWGVLRFCGQIYEKER